MLLFAHVYFDLWLSFMFNQCGRCIHFQLVFHLVVPDLLWGSSTYLNCNVKAASLYSLSDTCSSSFWRYYNHVFLQDNCFHRGARILCQYAGMPKLIWVVHIIQAGHIAKLLFSFIHVQWLFNSTVLMKWCSSTQFLVSRVVKTPNWFGHVFWSLSVAQFFWKAH